MDWVIYVLKDPRTREVRYVGWTKTSAESRLRTHISEAVGKPPRTRRTKWMFSLISIGLIPLVEVVESGTGGGWQDAERRWIAFYRASGTRLVNGTDGGDGTVGWGTYEDRCIAARKSIASQTPEQLHERAKKGQAHFSPEQRSAIAAKRMISTTFEQRSAIAKQREARRTPEERSASAKKRQANKTFEERSASARKGVASRTPEEWSASAKKREARKTPEERARSGQWLATRTPEQRRAFAIVGNRARQAKHRAHSEPPLPLG